MPEISFLGIMATLKCKVFQKLSVLDVKQKVHYVSVFDHIFLTFNAQNPAGSARGLILVAHIVIIGDDFGTDESTLKVGVNDSGRLRGLPANVDGPGPNFLRSYGKVAAQTKSFVASANDAHKAAFFNAVGGQHFCLLRVGEALQLFFQFGADAGKARMALSSKCLK